MYIKYNNEHFIAFFLNRTDKNKGCLGGGEGI